MNEPTVPLGKGSSATTPVPSWPGGPNGPGAPGAASGHGGPMSPVGGPAGAMGDPSRHESFGAQPAGSPGVGLGTLVLVETRRLWMRRSTKWICGIALFFSSLTWFLPLMLGIRSGRPLPFVPAWTALSGMSAIICAGFMSLAAASFICAEYSSGSMANWLTFEPRRIRVAASKYAALMIGTAVLILVAVLLSLLGALLIGATDFSESTQTSFREAVGADVAPGWPMARLLLLCFGAVLATACVALVIRNTSGTIGFFVLWGLIVEGFINGGMARSALSPALPGPNAAAFLAGGLRYSTGGADYGYDYSSTHIQEIGLVPSTVYLVLLAVVLVAGSLALFHRRDVA